MSKKEDDQMKQKSSCFDSLQQEVYLSEYLEWSLSPIKFNELVLIEWNKNLAFEVYTIVSKEFFNGIFL